ncbi:MAG TPA: hypothetical protein VJ831_00995 [Jatrophihabitantaceae bacterium]|nr:hypothetical protein [Jatrophihabitantaceae bacterium]
MIATPDGPVWLDSDGGELPDVVTERGPHHPRTPWGTWAAIAVVVVVVISAAGLVRTSDHDAAAKRSSTSAPGPLPSSHPTPVGPTAVAPPFVVNTVGAVDGTVERRGDFSLVSDALQLRSTGEETGPDGTVIWTADLENIYGLEIRASDPIRVLVPATLRAEVLDARLSRTDGSTSRVSTIEKDDVVEVRVRLRFDCSTRQAAPVEYQPIGVVITLFGFAAPGTFVLDGAQPPGESPCPKR